jgi:hypothetical protein
MTDVIGSIGTRLDIQVRAGDSLGPITFTLKDGAGAALDLTGSTFSAALSKLDSADGEIAMTAAVSGDPTLGVVQVHYAAVSTVGLTGSDFFSADAQYAWKLRMIDSVGDERTLVFGYVKVAVKDLP